MKSEIVHLWGEIASESRKKNTEKVKLARQKLEEVRHKNFNKCSFPGCKMVIARCAKMCKMHSLSISMPQRKKRLTPDEILAKIQAYDFVTVLT